MYEKNSGMTAASFTILFMRIKLEWHSIIFCNLGAIFGLIIGLKIHAFLKEKNTERFVYLGFEVIDEALPPVVKKLSFVSVWFSFAFALYLLNR